MDPLGTSTDRSDFSGSVAASQVDGGASGSLSQLDLNQLQTALSTAVAAEDYERAAEIKSALQAAAGQAGYEPADWYKLGVPDWLADRAERMGFKVPTGAHGWHHFHGSFAVFAAERLGYLGVRRASITSPRMRI